MLLLDLITGMSKSLIIIQWAGLLPIRVHSACHALKPTGLYVGCAVISPFHDCRAFLCIQGYAFNEHELTKHALTWL